MRASAAGLVRERREPYAQDRSFGFYYGTRGQREEEQGGLDYGGGLKFTGSNINSSKAGLKPAIDFGALYRFKERYAAGASILNFFSPKFAGGGLKDRAPLTLKVGLAEQVRDAAAELLAIYAKRAARGGAGDDGGGGGRLGLRHRHREALEHIDLLATDFENMLQALSHGSEVAFALLGRDHEFELRRRTIAVLASAIGLSEPLVSDQVVRIESRAEFVDDQ